MQAHHSSDQIRRPQSRHAPVTLASRSASFDRRGPSDDSWVEISSQPSSSSLSSIGDDVVAAGLRVQHNPRARRRRTLRPGAPSHLNVSQRPQSVSETSSQEEYEESESESDRVMTSSGEGVAGPQLFPANDSPAFQPSASEGSAPQISDDDDENKTAINYPISHNGSCFTPQPNAFSHPPTSSHTRPVSGSYFPPTRPGPRPISRQSTSGQQDQSRQCHLPQNILSPSYNAAAQHDEALRASLSTLLSCAAAARGLTKADNKRSSTAAAPARSNRSEPLSLRLVPESALPTTMTSPPQFYEPTFQPTIRRPSTSTSSTSAERIKQNKRKARASSRERRALKKARQSSSSDESYISPTLMTWIVSAGVVVFLSALSFSAGYSLGREAGRLETAGLGTDEQLRTCAREASRSSLGLKRSLARSAVQV